MCWQFGGFQPKVHLSTPGFAEISDISRNHTEPKRQTIEKLELQGVKTPHHSRQTHGCTQSTTQKFLTCWHLFLLRNWEISWWFTDTDRSNKTSFWRHNTSAENLLALIADREPQLCYAHNGQRMILQHFEQLDRTTSEAVGSENDKIIRDKMRGAVAGFWSGGTQTHNKTTYQRRGRAAILKGAFLVTTTTTMMTTWLT